MTAPLIDIDAAIIHVATVLVEQGYKPHAAYQAATRIVYKCAIACTSAVQTAKLKEDKCFPHS